MPPCTRAGETRDQAARSLIERLHNYHMQNDTYTRSRDMGGAEKRKSCYHSNPVLHEQRHSQDFIKTPGKLTATVIFLILTTDFPDSNNGGGRRKEKEEQLKEGKKGREDRVKAVKSLEMN